MVCVHAGSRARRGGGSKMQMPASGLGGGTVRIQDLRGVDFDQSGDRVIGLAVRVPGGFVAGGLRQPDNRGVVVKFSNPRLSLIHCG